jgi:hypothetical protein
MSSVRVRLPANRASESATAPGERESRLSRLCLLWFFVAPFVGFALAGRVFHLGIDGGGWELWKAALLGGMLTAPYAVGAYLGLRGVLKGSRGGWVGFGGNILLGVVSLVAPITESLTS